MTELNSIADATPPHQMLIALGGGGDVITATGYASTNRSVVVSLAWEKQSVDPLPGPRRPSEMSSVVPLGAGVVLATTETRYPNGFLSNQARLLAAFPDVPQVLIDPWDGVEGLELGLRTVAEKFAVSKVIGIDVGGDLLCREPSPTLTSPLADAIMTSAMWRLTRDATAIVFGVGLDGEIPQPVLQDLVRSHLRTGGIMDVVTLPMQGIRKILSLIEAGYLESEVSTLLLRAYEGMQGRVLFRNGGLRVDVGADAVLGYAFPVDLVATQINPLCQLLSDTQSLEEANRRLLAGGYRTELDEQLQITRSKSLLIDDEVHIRHRLEDAVGRLRQQCDQDRVDYVADRHLAKLVGCSVAHIRQALVAAQERLRLELFYPYVGIGSRQLP